MPSSGESTDQLHHLEALVEIGLRLARAAPTGRIVLARIAAAIDPIWIPRPWGDEIAAQIEAARATALDPLDASGVERALRNAWGSRPTGQLNELDLDPIAVTPIAQVHRGLLDGSAVAVKVLRPGLAAAVRQDLALLDALTAPLTAAFPGLEPRAVLAELRERISEELDLEHEAQAQRRFHRALRDHPFLSVPAPITRLATEDVLVSEWVQGTPMDGCSDRDAAAKRLAIFLLGGARFGVMHADPHPDDVLVLPDGGLAILDFGLTRTVEAERVTGAASALDALIADDPDAFCGATHALGWLPGDHGAVALELARYALGDLVGPGPVRLDSAAVVAMRDRLFERPGPLARLLLAGALPAPDLWPLRGVAQLFATIARVGATGAWVELAQTAIRQGWDVAV